MPTKKQQVREVRIKKATPQVVEVEPFYDVYLKASGLSALQIALRSCCKDEARYLIQTGQARYWDLDPIDQDYLNALRVDPRRCYYL